MSHSQQRHSARVNVGGQEVNINIDMGGSKPHGPIHFSGDERLPDGVASVKTEQELHMGVMNASSSAFSNPEQNARRIGFKEGMKVADFGAGSGAHTIALADVVGASGVVYAVDVQRDLLTRIQNNAVQAGHDNVEVVWGNMEEFGGLSIRDDLLDGVLLSNTLFQVDDKLSTIKEAWRVLKPSGVLAIIDWLDSFGGMGPPQNSVVTQAEATLLCTDNGFAFKKDIPVGEHHYGLVFVKMVAGETIQQTLANSHTKEENFISRTISQELL